MYAEGHKWVRWEGKKISVRKSQSQPTPTTIECFMTMVKKTANRGLNTAPLIGQWKSQLCNLIGREHGNDAKISITKKTPAG